MDKPDASRKDAPKHPSRRLAVAGLGAAAVGGAAVLTLRRPDRGQGGHDAHFQGLSKALARAGIAHPVLVVDRQRLAHNIGVVKDLMGPSGHGVRVVVKSLPSLPLIEAVADGLNTNRYMVFNGAMLAEMRQRRPRADLLMGKPLPVVEAAQYYDAPNQAPVAPQWLIDTPARLKQFAEMARARSKPLRVNIEIDVGLHRGGFKKPEDLAALLDLIKTEAGVTVTGLMGYDPHVPKTPNPAAAYAAEQRAYGRMREVLAAKLGGDVGALTLNTAGSPTYALHKDDKLANEVSIGSAFVKPTDFDLKTLTPHVPAAFIATPVIKALDDVRIPSLEALSGAIRFYDPNTERAFFIYGGHWMAEPVSPPGLQFNDLFGRSSNQELLTGSRKVALHVDDYVFFRPHQSEALFLQFGDIAVYEGGEISARWPTFPVSA
ncbi:MAG: alanine racemase [Pseudomonadota bacterium]